MNDSAYLKAAVEGLLFLSGSGLTISEIAAGLGALLRLEIGRAHV